MDERCRSCNRQATVCIQKRWVLWDYSATSGLYDPRPSILEAPLPIASLETDSLYFCQDCALPWLRGLSVAADIERKRAERRL